jgi:cytochrome P450
VNVTRSGGAGARRAMAHERRLYLAAHPIAYPLLRALARCGPVLRVPGIGVVVNDARLAREVLLDGEHFRKDGPGSPGDLWTPVLGPSVLLNMEGEAHRELRRKLADLLTPNFVAGICQETLAGPLERLGRQLEGRVVVDLVDTMRVMAAAVICAVIGLEVSGSEQDQERFCRHLFEAGESIVATIRLGTRRLSPGQIERAKQVLHPIGETAAKSYALGDESTVMGRMRVLGLSEPEARGAAGAFFLTGTETVASFLPRLIALLHDTGSLSPISAALLDGDEGPFDRALEEAMRVTTPTPVMLRSVTARTRIGSVLVRPGDRVVIATHNCCRAWGGLDLSREQPHDVRRLWFGAGVHFCIGYPLAMAEIRAVARAVLERGPLRIVSRRAAYGVLIPTYRRLEVACAS